MRSAKVSSISDHGHYGDYAELNPWQDRPDLTEGQRKHLIFAETLATVCGYIFGIAVWVGVCSFFVWAAVGGWRLFHHGVDLIIKAFQ